jgi:hypothetical protein
VNRAKSVKRLFAIGRLGILRRLREMNVKKAEYKPLRSEFKRSLQGDFEGEIRKLERVLNRDFDIWREAV